MATAHSLIWHLESRTGEDEGQVGRILNCDRQPRLHNLQWAPSAKAGPGGGNPQGVRTLRGWEPSAKAGPGGGNPQGVGTLRGREPSGGENPPPRLTQRVGWRGGGG